MAMRTTDEHKLAHEKALGLFNGPTKMEFFEVVDRWSLFLFFFYILWAISEIEI